MTNIKQIYKCNVCGNIVEVIHAGVGDLVCCGQTMEIKNESKKDEGYEKHVPVIEKVESGVKVRVGSVPHPMEENHFIEWIEVISGDHCYRKFLKPGELPEVEMKINLKDKISIREYCNVHGLWSLNDQ